MCVWKIIVNYTSITNHSFMDYKRKVHDRNIYVM